MGLDAQGRPAQGGGTLSLTPTLTPTLTQALLGTLEGLRNGTAGLRRTMRRYGRAIFSGDAGPSGAFVDGRGGRNATRRRRRRSPLLTPDPDLNPNPGHNPN